MRRRHLVPRFWSSAVKHGKMISTQNLLTPHLTLLHLWHFIKIYLKVSGNAKLNRIHAKAVFCWSEEIFALISDTHESDRFSKRFLKDFFSSCSVVLCQTGALVIVFQIFDTFICCMPLCVALHVSTGNTWKPETNSLYVSMARLASKAVSDSDYTWVTYIHIYRILLHRLCIKPES